MGKERSNVYFIGNVSHSFFDCGTSFQEKYLRKLALKPKTAGKKDLTQNTLMSIQHQTTNHIKSFKKLYSNVT
jgi:hypothetical protein